MLDHAVTLKTFHKKKRVDDNAPWVPPKNYSKRPSSSHAAGARTAPHHFVGSHVSSAPFRENLRYPVNFYRDTSPNNPLPPSQQLQVQQTVELALPSFNEYEANRESIVLVEEQLSKAMRQRSELQAEQDKLEYQKQTIVGIKRAKEIDQELKDINANILKFKMYLKKYSVFRE